MTPRPMSLAIGLAALLAAPAAHAATNCLVGYMSAFQANAGTAGNWTPNMTLTVGGQSLTIGKDGQAPSPTESWDTLRSAAQAAFLAQTPVQVIASGNNCPSPSGAAIYAIRMCLNAADCGVSTPAPSRARQPDDQ